MVDYFDADIKLCIFTERHSQMVDVVSVCFVGVCMKISTFLGAFCTAALKFQEFKF